MQKLIKKEKQKDEKANVTSMPEWKTEKPKRICKLCKKEINTKIDGWCKIIDYEGEEVQATGYYHKVCFTGVMKNREEKLKRHFIEGAKGMIDRLNIKMGDVFGNGGL